MNERIVIYSLNHNIHEWKIIFEFGKTLGLRSGISRGDALAVLKPAHILIDKNSKKVLRKDWWYRNTHYKSEIN